MKIDRLVIQNFKKFDYVEFQFDPETNIIVGDNESGKSTLLEAIEIVLNGELHGRPLLEELTVGLFNSKCVKKFLKDMEQGGKIEFPEILIEAFIPDLQKEFFRGIQNSMGEDTTGIKVTVGIDYSIDKGFYQDTFKRLDKDTFNSLPVEFYSVKWQSFSDNDISVLFDKGKKPIQNIFVEQENFHLIYDKNKYIRNVLTEKMKENELLNLNYIFRQTRNQFDKFIGNLNKNLDSKNEISSKKLKITTDVDSNTALEDNLQFTVDEIPFAYIGKGEQNQIQIKLSLHNVSEDENTKIILIDEIENHLSHMNLVKLIGHIEKFHSGKQIFAATHSSYVLNKMSIDKLILVGKNSTPLRHLNDSTIDEIKRLPGYDTLRIVLTDRVILVEGPSDELIIKKLYKNKYTVLPEEDGIEVIVVHGLRFHSYLDIAKHIGTRTSVIVDNDGNFDSNVGRRFSQYGGFPEIGIFAPTRKDLNTLEPSLIDANSSSESDLNYFASIVLPPKSFESYKKTDQLPNRKSFLEKYFKRNAKRKKVEAAIKIFDNGDRIKFPLHLHEAIDHVK